MSRLDDADGRGCAQAFLVLALVLILFGAVVGAGAFTLIWWLA